MNWFNFYGIAIMIVIMLPNILFALTVKNANNNENNNKVVLILEQVGRYGCMGFMCFNIPYTYFNFWFAQALYIYIGVNGFLLFLYIVFWIICWNKNNLLKALSLSIIPSVIFLFSGIMLLNIPLIIFSIIFAINHILISCKNVVTKGDFNGNK